MVGALYLSVGNNQPGLLLIAIHHLAIDGVSWRILLEELETASTQLRGGEPIRLPKLSSSFGRWANLIQEYGKSPELAAELEYWIESTGAKAAPVPADRSGGINLERTRRSVEVALTIDETRRLLRDVPATYGTHINEVLLTGLVLAFSEWTGQRELLVDLEGHGREELFPGVDLSRTTGWFTTIFPVLLPVVADAGSMANPVKTLEAVKSRMRSIPNNGIGFGLLKYLSGDPLVRARLAQTPRAEVSFNYLGQIDSLLEGGAPIALADRPAGATRSPAGVRSHLLEIDGMVTGGRLKFEWAYSEEVHFRITIERLARSFTAGLRILIEGAKRSRETGARGLHRDTSRESGQARSKAAGTVWSSTEGAGPGEIPRIPDSGRVVAAYPLSPMQQGLLFHTLADEDPGVYCTQIVCDLKGAVDPNAFERAWQLLVERDAVLRTAFEWEGTASGIQAVAEKVDISLAQHDWRGVVEEEKIRRLQTYLGHDRARGFDLHHAPLMRLSLIRTGSDEYVFIWSFHHLLIDGWSVGIIAQELFALYSAAVNGTAPTLEYRGPYAGYISWLGTRDDGESEIFWTRYLEGLDSPTRLPMNQMGDSGRGGAEPADQEVHLSQELTARLQAVAGKNGLTLNTMVQGMWGLVVSAYTNEHDVVFGVVVSGRSAPISGIGSMTGLFINTLPARARIVAHRLLLEWLTEQQSQQAACRQHEHSPLSKIQEWSQIPRGESLFDTILVFENYPLDQSLLKNVEGFTVLNVRSIEQTNYPLTVTVTPGPRLELQVSYSISRFEATAISRMLAQMESVLDQMSENVSRALGDIRVTTSVENQVLLENSTGPRTLLDDCCVYGLIRSRALQSPESVALVFESEHVTYGRADRDSGGFAHHLRARGIGVDSRVGICLDRSIRFVVAVLAVMRAGAAAVPIAPDTPEQRLVGILSDCGASMVVTLPRLLPTVRGAGLDCVLVDDFLGTEATFAPDLPSLEIPGALAYIIHTSGSTGRPKGVMVSHRALGNCLRWMAHEFPLSSRDRLIHKYSIAFDASWLEVFYPLAAGATLVIAMPEGQSDIDYLVNLISEERITALDAVPSMLSALVGTGLLESCRSLGQLTVGGEALASDLVERAERLLPGVQITNAYGPTEATINCTVHRITGSSYQGTIPIGRAISNSEVSILDPFMRVAPIGAVGEMHVGGLALAWGYVNQSGMTADRFVPNPRCDGPGDRLYRTGDLARYLHNGNLEFAGRTDHQVKLHGFRVELEEVESALRKHEAIRDAVVVPRNDGGTVNGLVAYIVVPGPEFEADDPDWRAFLRESLPEYMIPTLFMTIDRLPLTAAGKIDRRALPAYGPMESASEPVYVPAATSTQKRLAEIWAEALGVERVGLSDNFFALGGDSIISISVVSRARRSGIAITHKQLFAHPTVGELSRVASAASPVKGQDGLQRTGIGSNELEWPPRLLAHAAISSSLPDDTGIELSASTWNHTSLAEWELSPGTLDYAYPLTPAQEGILFHSLYEGGLESPGTGVYCVQFAWEIHGPLDLLAFKSALRMAVDAHAALRTGFEWRNIASPVQVVHRTANLSINEGDLSGLGNEDRAVALDSALAEDRRQGYWLNEPPLMRLWLIRTSTRIHQCIWSCHHLILDGWSVSLVLKEILVNYNLLIRGSPRISKPEPAYRSYVEWLARQDQDEARRYWTDHLSGIEPGTLSSAGQSIRSRRAKIARPAGREIVLDDEMLNVSLKRLSARFNVTLNTVFEVAWALLLGRLSGRDDVVYGRVVSGRPDDLAGVEEMVGLFINTIPVRISIPGNQPVVFLIQQRQSDAIEARDFEHSSLVDIQNWLRLEKFSAQDASPARGDRASLFESILVFENYPVDAAIESWLEGKGSEIVVKNVQSIEPTNYPLALIVLPGEKIRIQIAYHQNRFDDVTVSRTLEHLRCVLEDIASNPGKAAGSLRLLTEAESHQLQFEWNDAAAAYPEDALIVELFEQQLNRAPDAVAVEHRDEQVCYRALNDRANRLAVHLVGTGARYGDPVALSLDRGIGMIVAMLAVLKLGAAYVPIDSEAPPERVAALLSDAAVRTVVSSSSQAGRLLNFEGSTVWIDSAGGSVLIAEVNQVAFVEPGHGEDVPSQRAIGMPGGLSAVLPAYVVYTSGSTGKPKGVAVPHRAVARLVMNSNYASLSETTVVAQASSASFDAATFEIWGSLLNGGRIVVIDKNTTLSPEAFRGEILDRRIDALFLTTALFNQVAAESSESFQPLNTLLFGGEAVDPVSVRNVIASAPPRELRHVYGPTESTTFASSYLTDQPRGDGGTIPIGWPISNTRLYLLDPELRGIHAGVPGEIFIGGDGLALGYVNRPELTADRFIPGPFGESIGGRVYRTGDIARFRNDGAVEFIGRSDRQAKIRGFRIEPGEIEAALKQSPRIQDSLVTVRRNARGEMSLAAYIVPRGPIDPEVRLIRSELAAILPGYMIPSSFVVVPALPLNEHGKIDRAALPDPEDGEGVVRTERARPRTETEEALCWIWSEMLGRPVTGVDDDFFELGGHSLLATRITSRIRYFFEVNSQIRDIFEYPTIAGLAERIEAAKVEERSAGLGPIERRSRDTFPPLSFAQQRLWFLDQVEECGAAYNIPALFRVIGTVNILALEQGLSEIVRRHEALRTSFPTRDGVPYQLVSQLKPVTIRTIDLTELAASERDSAAGSLIAVESGRLFDLGSDAGPRVSFVRLSEGQALLLIAVHHIVADGWSLEVLLREASELCRLFDSGSESQLDELSIQYADFSAWQRDLLNCAVAGGGVFAEQLEYWVRQLESDQPPAGLFLDRKRPMHRGYRGSAVAAELPRPVSDALGKAGFQRRATPFMGLLAGFYALMRRYTGQSGLRAGTVIANRNYAEIEELIGYFTNTLVLKADIAGDSTFEEVIDLVRAMALEAYRHQDLPFEMLVDSLKPGRSLSETPLFQVMFVLNRNSRPSVEFPGARLTAQEADTRTAKFDLTVSIEEAGGTYLLVFEYDTDLFERATMDRMLEHWTTMLAAFAGQPRLRVAEAPMLSRSAREMLVGWSKPTIRYEVEQCLHSRFCCQAHETPDAVALVCEDEHVTYGTTNIRANQLGRFLKGRGVAPEDVVGVCLDRTTNLVVVMLGVLKAGAAYAPLEPGYPDERLGFTIRDSRMRVVVTDERFEDRLNGSGAALVCLDREWRNVEMESPAELDGGAEKKNIAYVIYTSGSTGLPKGVMVTHENIVRLFDAAGGRFQFGRADVWTMFHSAAFDFSVWEIWGALTSGGKLVVVPFLTSREPELFHETVVKEGVTVLNQTPSAFNQFTQVSARLNEDRQQVPALRLVIFGGEALEFRNLGAWMESIGDQRPRIVNMYGITETTVHVTYRRVTRTDIREDYGSRIGSQIEDLGLYLIDASGELVPTGVPGEMWVGGAGVARGYLGKPDLTAERFPPDQYGGAPGGRAYKSGDRAKRIQAGELEYLGRIDQQVKIRGYRIEPGAVESQSIKCAGVCEARVIATADSAAKRLIAYVVLDSDAQGVGKVREELKSRLPEYMAPAAIVQIDRMPLTPNGKLDIRALLNYETPAAEDPAGFLAPEGELEEAIARVWSEVLNVPDASVEANFFDLGGNSISLVHVRNKLRDLVDKEITMVDMFTYTSIRSLASHLGKDDNNHEMGEMESGIEARKQSRRRPKQNRKLLRVDL
ncbi:MAG TPA: amino acid adenylation domain-containing protein [Blastocatellia bacterium]|nr:amino acid adenylation domain-containing protein [Blastocatellia bacterium]